MILNNINKKGGYMIRYSNGQYYDRPVKKNKLINLIKDVFMGLAGVVVFYIAYMALYVIGG